MKNFAGKWNTYFGTMDLAQKGGKVQGTYGSGEKEHAISGTVEGKTLTFTYQEGDVAGAGWFEMNGGGEAFAGQYRPEGDEDWYAWAGTRIGFGGVWETTFGMVRLIEEGELVRGFYEPGAVIDGSQAEHELTFTYQETQARGKGRFTLAEDGMTFDGAWQQEGRDRWKPWTGRRVVPKADLTWLVVIEAPWQASLMEREYSFGNMLWEFFARLSDVEVRQRFFANEESLRQYCREVMYLAEPVYLWLATHALPDGITVNGRTIAVARLLEYLRHVPDLRLVHLSACLLMKEPGMRGLFQTFTDQVGVPISGYTTSVNWGASALLEFTYLELILSRGYTSAEAAKELPRLLPFAGDKNSADDVFPATGFRMLTPKK